MVFFEPQHIKDVQGGGEKPLTSQDSTYISHPTLYVPFSVSYLNTRHNYISFSLMCIVNLL